MEIIRGYIKKGLMPVIILIVLLLCGGCGKGTNSGEDPGQNSHEQQTADGVQKGVDPLYDEAAEIQDYDPNREIDDRMPHYIDDQVMYSVVRESQLDGTSESYIYVLDLETGIQLPLCNKIDCNHKNDRCNACFEGDINMIYKLNHGIYLLGNKISMENGQTVDRVFFTRVSEDGSIRTDLGEIAALYGAEGTISTFQAIIHRGWLYYELSEYEAGINFNGEGLNASVTQKIYRYNINGKGEPELIHEETMEDGGLTLLYMPQGDYLYTQSHYSKYDYSGDTVKYAYWKCEEYRINLNTLEEEPITEEINYCQSLTRGEKSYINYHNAAGDMVMIEHINNGYQQTGIGFYDSKTGEMRSYDGEELSDRAVVEAWVENEYIYLNTNGLGESPDLHTYVYDLNWNLVARLDFNIAHCYGDYLFWRERTGNDKRNFYIGKRDDVINGAGVKGLIYTENGTKRQMQRDIYSE